MYFTVNGNTRTGIDKNGIHYTTVEEDNVITSRDDDDNILWQEYTFGSRRFGYDKDGHIWMENEHPRGNKFTGLHSNGGMFDGIYSYTVFDGYEGGFASAADRWRCRALLDEYDFPSAYQMRADLTFITD